MVAEGVFSEGKGLKAVRPLINLSHTQNRISFLAIEL